jgi:hypothetical protein
MASPLGKHQQEAAMTALMHQPQEQQQQTELDPLANYDRDVEYSSAQRAAAEAIQVGRETLEAAVRQGEQLKNAESMADETEYKLDKANRLLRGMTWSGWLANKFSRDVEPPEYKQSSNKNSSKYDATSVLGPPRVYEHVPDACAKAAQSLQNYHANLQVLEDCETEEQRETCKIICDNMHRQAAREVDSLRNSDGVTSYQQYQSFAKRLGEDLDSLRNRQLVLQQLHRGLSVTGGPKSGIIDQNRAKLLENSKGTDVVKSSEPSPIDLVTAKQEEHLDSMAKHLNELGALAGHLNISLASHTETLESLDEKNDSMLFKSKVVTRRADRLIQNKSWMKEKAEFVKYATIQHKSSGRYLSVAPNQDSTLVLSKILNERCIFGVWKRKRALGLQNQYNKRWAGQSLLSQLTCSASTFGRREEWDVDNEDDWSNTTLLIASAGWGTGAYLMLNKNGEGNLPYIGGGGLDDKKLAPAWCFQEFQK